MHFEMLVEDLSGSIVLGHILEKILGPNYTEHSWRIIEYKGIGRIPKDLRGVTVPTARILLDRLPRILRGYGRSLQDPQTAVVVVVDADRKDCVALKQDLLGVLNACNPRPKTLFRIAVEEVEAWLLGDRPALTAAYPNANVSVLNSYVQDDICGTWEILADAIHPGGASYLKSLGYPPAGVAKCDWASSIAPNMDVDGNQSKSFRVFRDGVRKLAGIQP